MSQQKNVEKKYLTMMAVMLSSFVAAKSFAQTNYRLWSTPYNLAAGASHSFVLDRSAYVTSIVIQAISARGGMFEVRVDGRVKGTVNVPAYDPSYTVTIAENTDSFEFVNISSGDVTVQAIDVDANRGPASTSSSYYDATNVSPEDLQAIKDFAADYRDYYSGTDYDTIWQPVRVACANALSALRGGWSLSSPHTVALLQKVVAAIDRASPKLEAALLIRNQEDNAQYIMDELEGLRRKLM